MHNNHQTLLGQLPVLTPPSGLIATILERVLEEKRRVARIRLAIFGFMALGSLLAFVPVFRYASEEFSRSGFIEYSALLFSDVGSVFLHWREFSLSLIESLPFFGLTIFLATLLVLLGSFQLFAKNVRMAFLSTRLA